MAHIPPRGGLSDFILKVGGAHLLPPPAREASGGEGRLGRSPSGVGGASPRRFVDDQARVSMAALAQPPHHPRRPLGSPSHPPPLPLPATRLRRAGGGRSEKPTCVNSGSPGGEGRLRQFALPPRGREFRSPPRPRLSGSHRESARQARRIPHGERAGRRPRSARATRPRELPRDRRDRRLRRLGPYPGGCGVECGGGGRGGGAAHRRSRRGELRWRRPVVAGTRCAAARGDLALRAPVACAGDRGGRAGAGPRHRRARARRAAVVEGAGAVARAGDVPAPRRGRGVARPLR